MFLVAYNTNIIKEKLLVYIRQIFEKTPHEEQRTSSEKEEKVKRDKEEEEKEIKKEETYNGNNELFVNRNIQ